MKVIALVENFSETELKAKHGLSLYIETSKHKLLFDVGMGRTLFDNAKLKGIDLTKVDTLIISHGHGDHGRGLKRFLDINKKAKVYVQKKAFDPHFTKAFFLTVPVGIDAKLANHPQVILLEGDYIIDDELSLFTVQNSKKCYSPANDALFDKDGLDSFSHEQNLLIKEDKTSLILGCGHAGVVNIMEKAAIYEPAVCIGGYHLYNPITKKTASLELLSEIANELKKYKKTQFYTCHCTGKEAFNALAKELPNMNYLSCGQEFIV